MPKFQRRLIQSVASENVMHIIHLNAAMSPDKPFLLSVFDITWADVSFLLKMFFRQR